MPIIFIATAFLFVFTSGSSIQMIEKQIEKDFLSGNSAVERKLADVVAVHVSKVKNGVVYIDVQSPNIENQLKEYIDDSADLSYEDIEKKIMELLDSSLVQKQSFELVYKETDDGYMIYYTDDFGNAISCGLVSLYRDLMKNIIRELEEMP